MSTGGVFRTEYLTRWQDIEKYAKHAWLFRGQREADWKPKTSLERCCDHHNITPGNRRNLERLLFRDFRRAYHHYTQHIPSKKAVIEWLSLMQHHGAPTRLLDFTYSIYVAAYFATEAASGESAIWAIDGPWVMKRAITLLRAAGKSDADLKLLTSHFEADDEEAVSRLFFGDPYVCAAWPISAFRLNERLRIQQGVFLITGDISQTFMANLIALSAPDSQDHLLKIIIPYNEGREALRHLFSMHLSRTNLFPGLDGYAQSLNVWNPAFDPINWDSSI
jgi:hypothetical protein